MFTDSHCHLNFPELLAQLPQIRQGMQMAKVERALCICTTIERFAEVHSLALEYDNFWATVGVHPDEEGVYEPSTEDLVQRGQLDKILAIGETGLDYYQMQERKGGRTIADMEWQRERFRKHIQAAQILKKPLVIHTRDAANDTLALLREAGQGGGAPTTGVFHCFTESQEVAKAVLDMGYYISFSGIITFKAAAALRETAAYIPMERILIETDSPYLAPAPHRGKTNTPAYVPLVAQQLAETKGLAVEEVGAISSANFDALFAPKASGGAL